MAKSGKSVENIQNNVLGQFELAKRQPASTFIADEVQRARELREKFEKNEQLTNEQKYWKAKERIDEATKINEARFKQIATNTANYHSLLESFYNLFGERTDFSKLELESLLDEVDLKDTTLIEYTSLHANNTIVTITAAKCTKKYLQLKLHIDYEKHIYVKAEDFETTKNVERTYVQREDDVKLKLEYGNIIKFRQSATAQFLELIEKYNIDNQKNSTLKQIDYKDAWNFSEI